MRFPLWWWLFVLGSSELAVLIRRHIFRRRRPVIRDLWVIRVESTDDGPGADVRLVVRMPRSAARALLANLNRVFGIE